MPSTPDDTGGFEAQRSRLFALAYRLLGSAAEAEDAVQDTFLRWEAARHDAIVTPAAWLAKVLTNLCLNRLTSARVRREAYVGPWLPEPVRTEDDVLGPMDTVAQRESVSLALLVLLEKLTPAERAVFVLREAFGYGHRDIAEVLAVTEANSAQLYRRARTHLAADRPRFTASRAEGRRMVERFLAAATEGDLAGLERLFAEDVVAWADGGGKATAARRPILGVNRVSRYLSSWLARPFPDPRIEITEVNGSPAMAGFLAGRLAGVLVFEVVDGRIATVRTVTNPDKLRFLAGQLAG